jgi:predicted MFS family arabinose efflux permease
LLLWAGQSVNGLGTFVTMVALPLLAVLRLHASTFEVSALEAVEWVPALLIGLPAGALIDRSHSKRRIMIVANVAQAAAVASVPLTAAVGVISLGTVFAAAFAAGLANVFFQCAYRPFLRAIVDPGDLVPANVRLQGSRSIAQISGPALGGLLVQVIGAASALLADAASFVVSIVSLVAIRAVEPVSALSRERVRTEIADGLRYMARYPLLRSVAVVSAFANLLLTAISAVETVFLIRVVGVSPSSVGVLFGITGAGGLAGAFMTGRLQRVLGTSLTARGALAVTAPFALLLAATSRGAGLILFGVGSFVPCFGIAVASITFAGITQSACAPELLGRVSAASQLLAAATIPAGALLGGLAGAHFGTRWAILAAGIAYTLVGVLASVSSVGRAPELARPRTPDIAQKVT